MIVLAAGQGSRFEAAEHKLAQRVRRGERAGDDAANAIASRLPVVVVTTAAFADVARSSVASRDVVVLPEVGAPARGAARHGRVDRRRRRRWPNAGGWLVLPGDMPLVRPATLRRSRSALDHHPVAYAQHRGRRGHPVGFAAELYSELVALSGDEGARRLVARYPAFAVELDDPGMLIDIDTEADLVAARASPRAPRRRSIAEPWRCGAETPTQAVSECRRASATRRSMSRSRMPQLRSDAPVSTRYDSVLP